MSEPETVEAVVTEQVNVMDQVLTALTNHAANGTLDGFYIIVGVQGVMNIVGGGTLKNADVIYAAEVLKQAILKPPVTQ